MDELNNTPGPPADQPRFFFGWAIVGFTFVTQFVAMGTLFYAYGVLLKPLTEALDADRFTISLALSLQMALTAVLSPWVGRLIAEKPLRLLMSVGAGAMTLGFLAMSQVQNVWQLYVAYGVILAAGMAFVGPLPNNTLLANWFVRRRGMALGISQFGVSVSGTVIVPITAFLVLEYGWQTAVVVFSAIPLVILLPLIWRFAIRTPEEMGLFPDGDAHEDIGFEDQDGADWTMARAVRDRRIWQLVVILGPSFMGVGTVLLAMHSHITDLGMSALDASSVVALMTFMGAIAKPLFGTLADYLNQRWVMALSLACQIIGLTLVLVSDTYAGLMAAAVLFGLGYGAVMPMWAMLIGALFGRQAFSRVMGVMGPLTMPFTLLGLPFATYVFEITGSYLPAFTILIFGFAISLVALAFLRLPSEQTPLPEPAVTD